MNKLYDAIVIGAGPAGAIASAKLLKENKTVLVIEKTSFPRFVIGESLIPHCMDYLEELDLLPVLERAKFQIKNGVCFHLNEDTCPFTFANQYKQDAWKYTWQVKRAEFDQLLINEVALRGAEVIYEASVTAVETSLSIQTITFQHPTLGTQTVQARFLIDASGYGRVLPRLKALDTPVSTPPRGAIFSHVRDVDRTSRAGNNIFVHIFRNNSAWIWSIPFSDGTCSVGIVGDKDYIEEISHDNGQTFKQMIRDFPGLEGRFAHSQFLFDPKVTMNYAAKVKSVYGEGYVMAGNATEFLDPTFSSGVMFAISSGFHAGRLAAQHLSGVQVHWEKEYAAHMNKGIDVFRTYVNAWYDGTLATIFFSKNKNEDFMQQICSVLAGYVWDESNPFVTRHKRILHTLAHVIRMHES